VGVKEIGGVIESCLIMMIKSKAMNVKMIQM